jgi:hypothetical protein
MRTIFDDSLERIERLMKDQIRHARENSIQIDKVVLVGGFGDSPALQEFLSASLTEINYMHGTKMKMVFTPANTGAAGVATGAVMRALNKENGPKRIPCRSIGVLRHILYEPDRYPAEVLDQRFSFAELSEEEYIMRTLMWVIKAVSPPSRVTFVYATNGCQGEGELDSVHTITFESMHEFDPAVTSWIADETLFTSDTCVDDYYTRSHVKNRGE